MIPYSAIFYNVVRAVRNEFMIYNTIKNYIVRHDMLLYSSVYDTEISCSLNGYKYMIPYSTFWYDMTPYSSGYHVVR